MASSRGVARSRSIRTLSGVHRAVDRRPLALGVLALAAVAITHLVDYGAYDLRYRILDASLASSWSHRADLAVIGVGVAICCFGGSRERQHRAAWFLLGAILLFFFIDEVTSLHVHIGQLTYGKLTYAPLLLVLVTCLWRVTLSAETLTILLVGLALLLTSYAIHIVGPHVVHALGWGNDSWAYQVKVALKEGTEFMGLLLATWSLMLSAAAASDRTRGVRRHLVTAGSPRQQC